MPWRVADLVELIERPAWQRHAACRDAPVSLFFPDGRSASPAAGLAVCAMCPVREQCHAFADEHYELGIWGGTTERQRQRARALRSAV